MSISQRLTDVFQSAKELPFDDSSRFILFSDCHRGVNDWADEFANNQGLFFHALERYYAEGFTYIELGDVDELWENRAWGKGNNPKSAVDEFLGRNSKVGIDEDLEKRLIFSASPGGYLRMNGGQSNDG